VDKAAIWQVTDSERARFGQILADVDPADLSRPSLCDGWTVQDVAAHLTLSQIGFTQATVDMIKARGSFNRMINESARRKSAASTQGQLVAEIGRLPGSRRHPPGTVVLDPMVDILVHTQDAFAPIGYDVAMPVEPATVGATHVWNRGFPFNARKRLDGLRLVATDVDWSVGSGAEVRGPISAHLLLLTGRTQMALRSLTGPGVQVLRGR
jgi:uncharacterized protein (TIGR03083 family)